jgi:hypothetical protein
VILDCALEFSAQTLRTKLAMRRFVCAPSDEEFETLTLTVEQRAAIALLRDKCSERVTTCSY